MDEKRQTPLISGFLKITAPNNSGEKMIKYNLTKSGKEFLKDMPKEYSEALTPEFCDAVGEVVKKIQKEDVWENAGYFFNEIDGMEGKPPVSVFWDDIDKNAAITALMHKCNQIDSIDRLNIPRKMKENLKRGVTKKY